MIIKRWDTTANNNAGGWVEQYPKTTVDLVYTGDGTAQVFDTATDKIKPKYLPDSVFGGMKFESTITADDVDTAQEIVNLVNSAFADTVGVTPTPDFTAIVGSYWVASATAGTTFSLSNVTTATAATAAPSRYFCVIASNPGEEDTGSSSGLNLETGDWVIVTGLTGSGSSETPYVVTLSVINNTYRLASSTVAGIAKYGGTTDGGNRNYAATITSGNVFVNVPWTDTVYAHPTHNGTSAIGTETALADVTLVDSLSLTNGHIDSFTYRTLAAGDNVTITAANDGTITIASTDTNTVYTHPDYSYTDAAGVETNLSDITLIDSLTVNSTGHTTASTHRKLVAGTNVSITAAANGNITIASTDTNTTYSAGNGIDLSGTEFSVAAGVGLTQESSGLKMTQPFISSTSEPGSTYQVANNLWFQF